MSLKAKIEAVIYAAEEPVTLAQLAGLLGQEAQAELDALASRQLELVEHAVEPAAAEGEHAPAAVMDDAAPVPDAEPLSERAKAAAAAGDTPPATDAGEAAAQPGHAADGATDEARELAAEKRAAREAERRLREYLASIVAELIRDYATSDRGLEIREVAGGLRLATKPEYHDAVRGFVRSLKPPLKLSLQALETLAVVAYKQPVTAPEVSEIRGVDSGGVLGSLITRKLVTTAGRKQVVGRPMLYRTTKDFLLRFGLKDVAELPSIEEFEKMASELAEQEEISMPETADTSAAEDRVTHENLAAQKDVHEAQADGDPGSPASDHSPQDKEPDIIGTPEGDNEYAPDQPLAPQDELGLHTPRGSEPDEYKGEV